MEGFTCVAPPGNELYEVTAQAGLEELGGRRCLCRQVGLELWRGWAKSRQTKQPRSVGHNSPKPHYSKLHVR